MKKASLNPFLKYVFKNLTTIIMQHKTAKIYLANVFIFEMCKLGMKISNIEENKNNHPKNFYLKTCGA